MRAAVEIPLDGRPVKAGHGLKSILGAEQCPEPPKKDIRNVADGLKRSMEDKVAQKNRDTTKSLVLLERRLLRSQRSTTLNTVVKSKRQGLRTGAGKDVAFAISTKTFSNYVKTGQVRIDFCLGKEALCSKGDTRRSVTGYIDVAPPFADQVKITAHVPELQLGGVVFVASEHLGDEKKAEQALQTMGATAGLKVINAAASIEVVGGEVALSVRGTPYTNAADECEGENFFSCRRAERIRLL